MQTQTRPLPHVLPKPDVDVKIVDGAALVHILERNKYIIFKTFNDYAQLVLFLYVERMQQDDRECCLGRLGPIGRTSYRYKLYRGSCNHLHVSNSTDIDVDRKSFLRCDANKDSLFHILADAIGSFNVINGSKSTPHICPYYFIPFHRRPLRLVLHLRRSGHMATVICLPFVPSCSYEDDHT